MKAELSKYRSPEDEELQRKLAELAALETELADRELQLVTLQTRLAAFERRYWRIVGVRYARLDELSAQIAELLARQDPSDSEASRQARDARRRAEVSKESAPKAAEGDDKADSAPSEELKRVFRETAKQLHPDLAADEDEAKHRHSFMAEANAAFRARDAGALSDILRRFHESPERIKGQSVGERLVRTIRQIAQARRRLDAITHEIAELKSSESYRLCVKVVEARRAGRDLLAEMARAVDVEIQEAEAQLRMHQQR